MPGRAPHFARLLPFASCCSQYLHRAQGLDFCAEADRQSRTCVLKQENTANSSSRLRRPRTAAAILQNKSTELNTGKHDATVAAICKAETEKELEQFCPTKKINKDQKRSVGTTKIRTLDQKKIWRRASEAHSRPIY